RLEPRHSRRHGRRPRGPPQTGTGPPRAAGVRPKPSNQLALGMLAHATDTVVITAPSLLIPHLHLDLGYSLVEAGVFAAAPMLGTTVSLVAWGAVVDRF